MHVHQFTAWAAKQFIMGSILSITAAIIKMKTKNTGNTEQVRQCQWREQDLVTFFPNVNSVSLSTDVTRPVVHFQLLYFLLLF